VTRSRLSRAYGPPRTLAVTLLVASMTSACLYGADFDYPEPPAVPSGVRVLLSETARDNDNPMRGRVQIVATGRTALGAVLDDYRRAYPPGQGWVEVSGDHDVRQRLCLVHRSDGAATDVLEVFDYSGERLTPRRDRYLVVASRFQAGGGEQCGASLVFVPGGWT